MSARLAIACVLLSAACSGGGPASPSAPPNAPALGPFTIGMPIAPGDSATFAYALWPFGVHSGGHAPDGHPGFDIEYRAGAFVLAAADGVVLSVTNDAHDPSRQRVQLRHARDRGDYMTDYSNLTNVPPTVVVGATIARGSALGQAGAFVDGRSGMIHFQIADPTRNQPGVSESAIVSPADYFSTSARAELDAIWATASYRAEWCEPLLTNPRANTFPMTRTWASEGNSPYSRIVVTCPSDTSDMTFVAYGTEASQIEQGTLVTNYVARPSTVDFRLTNGTTRSGLYDIVSGSMRLSMGPPNGARPSSLDGAITFSTAP